LDSTVAETTAAARDPGTGNPIVWPATLVVGFNLLLFVFWFFSRRRQRWSEQPRVVSKPDASRKDYQETTLLPLAVTKAIEIIEDNCAEEMSASEIARQVRITTRSLSRLFIESLGRTIPQYINLVRIDKAIELIKESEKSEEQIRQEVGIPDARRFDELFRERTGQTPAEYIQKERE